MSRHERFALRSREDLSAKAGALGVSIPWSEDIGPLFRPLDLPGGKRLNNRLVVQPMEGADASEDGAPGELTFRRYRRFAAGGCGLIWFEATAIDPAGRSNPHQLMLSGETLVAFKRLVEAGREAAAGAEGAAAPVFILQLTHSGRFSKPEGIARPMIAQHNPFLDPLRGIPPDEPPVPDAELDRLKGVFLEAAGLAAEAGFDGVDIKACHGYLLGELLAARRRTGSRYGGDFANRTRLLVETIAAAHGRFPGLILASRLGVYDAIPYPYGFGVAAVGAAPTGEISAGGCGGNDPQAEPGAPAADLAEPLSLIGRLVAAGLSVVNMTLGIPAYQAHFGRPFDRPAAGGLRPEEHPLEGIARLIRLAETLQTAFPALPVVGTGFSWLRGLAPHVAAGVIEKAGASLIGLGRLSFAYPDLARDLCLRGAPDPKKLCVTCSGCTDLLRAGGPAGCIIRDKAVYRVK
jgi:2,4-dienoyl-CoA reductase-like NADH-dependent reductase (Old Yellow Enzyme family)